jgi:hypothetical protein
LSNGFLQKKNEEYYLTEQGDVFLFMHDSLYESFGRFTQPPQDALGVSKCKQTDRLPPNQLSEVERTEPQFTGSNLPDSEKATFPSGISRVFQRIDPEEFERELCSLGLGTEESKAISYWADLIFSAKPTLFSGKKSSTIKACLAYVGGKVFNCRKLLTQQKILQFYGLNVNRFRSNRQLVRSSLEIVQQARFFLRLQA